MERAPETPTSSSARRSQKRPHSPQDDRSSPIDPKLQTTDPGGSVLDSESKRDKLLRLLGGKKRKNETAASKWLERVRSREDELKVSTELESQFNESLTHKLTGQSRRHVGIGFHEESAPTQPENTSDNSANNNTQQSGEGKHKLGAKNDSRSLGGSILNPDPAPKSILDSLSVRAQRPGIYGKPNMPKMQDSGINSMGLPPTLRCPPPRPPVGAHGQGNYRNANSGTPSFVPSSTNYGNNTRHGYTSQEPGYAPNSSSIPPPNRHGQDQRSKAPSTGYGSNHQYRSMVPSSGYGHNPRYNNSGPQPPPQAHRSPPPGPQFVPIKSHDTSTQKPSQDPKSKNAFYAQFKKAS